jgi:hypothetical protein
MGIFKSIWEGWKKFARGFARVQAEIILFLFYFLIFTPYGLILKLFGHDPLNIRGKKASTWRDHEKTEFDPEKLRRQS